MKPIQNVIAAIDSWGSKEPQRPVYIDGQQSFTYGDLKQKSDNLAAYLAKNVPAKTPLVVFGELEFDMLVCFLAASKSGHSYIPIDAHTPKERIEMILSVAQPTAILSVGTWPAIKSDCEIYEAAFLQQVMATNGEHVPVQPVNGAENYYIIFTSGTTGVPKGVQISHDNLLSFVNWKITDFNLTEGQRFLAQAPYSFDLSVMDIYPALASGGSLVPLRKEIINDFKKLFATLPQLDIDVWVSTPSFMDMCLMEPTFDEEHVPSLKTFLFCGEELSKATAEKLLTRFAHAQIFNTYGPTEATVAISAIQVTKELLETHPRIPIGYVKEDTQVVIMNEDELCAEGEVGEIIIAGPSVSKGYLNNPEKTAAAFFEWQGQPAYRTGDAGKLTNGLLSYEGRIDFQIKLHGYRIELEDIDHHLVGVSYIKQAIVVPKYNGHKVQQLVAYVVADEHPFDKEFQLTKAIKEELAKTVMDYMIPQKFVYVPALPLTANGKIDRKGLINEVNAT